MIRPIALCLVLALTTSACGKDDKSPTEPTPVPVDPTMTETFSGTLAAGGARFFSFSVAVYGRVDLTLTSLGGQTEPSDVTIGLGLGVPRGTDCSTARNATTTAGASPQVSSTVAAGVYCARVYDTGTLTQPTAFVVTIAHP
jgi:hypothetical protein